MKASSGLSRLSELALRQRRQGLAKQLPPVTEILRGSLVERYVTCGNPACKCFKGERHGPMWYLTVTLGRGRAPSAESDSQIPHRSMPLALKALARWISAGDIALHQRSPQNFGDGRKLFGQALPALAQGQFRESAQSATCLHLSASITPKRASFANANLPKCES